MTSRLEARLAQLEARRVCTATPDTPEAHAAAAELERLFGEHDPDGSIRARFDSTADSQARAAAVVDLLERAGPEAERDFLNRLALAEGRQPCHVNAPERKES
jgi:hypothetical protein